MIRKAVVVTAFITAVAVIVFLARENAKHFENTIITQTQGHLSTIAQSQAHRIEAFVRDIQEELEVIAQNPRVQRAVANNESFDDVLAKDGYSFVEDAYNRMAGRADAVYRLDAKGIVQSRSPWEKRRLGDDYSNKPGVEFVLRTHKPYVSDIFTPSSKRKCISVCCPVFKEQQFIGIVRALVYLSAIHDTIERMNIGYKGYVWVADEHGRIIIHPDDTLIGKSVLAIKGCQKQIDKGREVELISGILRRSRGERTFKRDELPDDKSLMGGATVAIANRSWTVFACEDYDEISAPVKAHTRYVFVAAEFLILIFLAATMAFYKIQRKKALLEVQAQSAQQLESLNEQLRSQAAVREKAEEKLKDRTESLFLAKEKLETEASRRLEVQENMQHQIKQLNCFYGLSKLIETPHITMEQIFEETVPIIRSAYQYADLTCVRITFDGIHYKTDNFKKSEVSQLAQIKVYGDKAGVIEVYYLGQKQEGRQAPFLEEERDLLNAVAEHLGIIAGRRQTAEKLHLFRDLIDRSNDCIFILEPKWGRFLDVNSRACHSLGYTRQELLAMSFKDIEQSMPDESAWQQQFEKLKACGDTTIQGRHERKNRSVFFAETTLKLVTQKKENLIIAVARDVTERKEAEEKQAELFREIESINRELKDFAYVVSHDLKAPLRGIKTLVNWISSDYSDKLDDEGKEQMNLLMSRVERMHNLIDGVLQYSRVGRIKEKEVQVDLARLVPEVIDLVAPPKNITVTIEDELPVVACEETRIMQVFQNLLSNAIKYMDKPDGQVTVGCVEDDDCWKFSVADNGPGIEEKHFERIFKIFQTLSPRDEFESTGVGLTVVKKIVELYEGEIWIESEVGRGCTFFFTLPKQRVGIVDEKLEANIAC